ncbi:MAG: hypothetical protein OXU64_02935 [Gemmatimonadota bacterium]|nr:hypothetical protein [Gemmatimonadota bacterium]
MANIHQTMKRVASLYEDLLGTREEITRCVQELRDWQEENRAWRTSMQEAIQAAVKDVERIGRAVKRQREEIEVLASEARERWSLAYILFTLVVTMSSLLLMRAWTWLFPRW